MKLAITGENTDTLLCHETGEYSINQFMSIGRKYNLIWLTRIEPVCKVVLRLGNDLPKNVFPFPVNQSNTVVPIFLVSIARDIRPGMMAVCREMQKTDIGVMES